jgi:glutathione S-transferase
VAIDTGETERLVGVLNTALDGTDYLVGNKYSIADIASYGWVNMLQFSGIEINDFPNVKAWADRIGARPAVQKGCAIPSESSFSNAAYTQRLKDDKEFAEKVKEQIKAAKEKYSYKYASP